MADRAPSRLRPAAPIELAAAGRVVRGQVWPAGDAWVVLVHDLEEDLDAWAGLPAALAAGDFTTLAFDLPGHGLSDDPWEPEALTAAVDAAIARARTAAARRCFLVAAGASIPPALIAASASTVDALVVVSPRDAADGLPVIERATVPKLVLAGPSGPEAMAAATAFFQACRGWTVLSTFGGAGAGTALFRGPWGQQAREQVVQFLRDYRP